MFKFKKPFKHITTKILMVKKKFNFILIFAINDLK